MTNAPDSISPQYPMVNPIEHNRRAWDRRAREGRRFTRPIGEGELDGPRARPDRWAVSYGIRGRRVLCLGAGGGRQGPVYALAGGSVTVVDISEEQLAIDRAVASQRGLDIRTVRASMDDLSPLGEGEFELVIQPVSSCYVPDVVKMYCEVARVTRAGGLYISQHKQPTSMQAEVHRSLRGYEVVEEYYRSGPLPEVSGSLHREPGTLEFLHRWEQLVGGLCRSGFVLEDLSEPKHADPAAKRNTFGDRSRLIPPYVRLRARRIGTGGSGGGRGDPIVLP